MTPRTAASTTDPPGALGFPAAPAALEPAAPTPGRLAPDRGDSAAERVARTGAEMIGDACVVWLVAADGTLTPAATHHRDHRLRFALGAFLEQEPSDLAGFWPAQVRAAAAPVRLRRARLSDLAIDTGIGMRRAHALLVPAVADGRTIAVIAVVRDGSEPAYSLREEVSMRRIGAKAAAALAAGLGRLRGDGDGTGDSDDGGAGRPPFEGDGAAPPAWLMDHVGVGIWLSDADGSTTYVNTAMCELLGLPADRVVGRKMREFIDDVPQMIRGEYCMDAERCDRRLTQPDGRQVWLEMTSSPLIDDSGARRGTVSTAVDVTDRRQVELAARQRVPRAHRRQ